MNFDQGSTFFFSASVLALLPSLCMSVLSSVWTSKQKQNGIGNIGSYDCALYHPEQDKAPGSQNTAVCSLVYTGPILYPWANHCGETSEIMLTGRSQLGLKAATPWDRISLASGEAMKGCLWWALQKVHKTHPAEPLESQARWGLSSSERAPYWGSGMPWKDTRSATR